jgi:SsrA-binding protein
MKIIAQNRKAYHEYHVLENIEAGIVLTGDEVKSIRAGHISLVSSFAVVHQGELCLMNVSITPYSHAYHKEKDKDAATRSRKLLLHKRELMRLIGDISRKGITIVPLKVYLNARGRVKVDLGICKHKKAEGKKEAIKERDIKRETARELKNHGR